MNHEMTCVTVDAAVFECERIYGFMEWSTKFEPHYWQGLMSLETYYRRRSAS